MLCVDCFHRRFINARQQIAQLVGMSDVDVRADLSSRRRWPVAEGTSRCLETDLLGPVVGQHTNDANIASTPSSTVSLIDVDDSA